MATACGTCGDPVPVRERGRPAKFCSAACKAKAYRARKRAATQNTAPKNDDAVAPVEVAAASPVENTGVESVPWALPAIPPRVDKPASLTQARRTVQLRAQPGGRAAGDRGALVSEARSFAADLAEAAAQLAVAIETGRTGNPLPTDTAGLLSYAQRTLYVLGVLAHTPVSSPHASGPAARDENPEPVTETPPAAPVDAGPVDRDEIPAPVTETEREREEREWEEQAERERAEFERRLKPVPEFGDGYQMAEWADTGRYHLVYRGERIGHATKKPFTTVWEAYSAHGPKIPFTSTFKTRRAALAEIARHHRNMVTRRAGGSS